MSNPDCQARSAGQAPGVLNKRVADDRPYLVDCAPLLKPGELILGIVSISPCGVQTPAARPRGGTGLEVRLAGGDLPEGRPSMDHPLSIVVTTTLGTLAVGVLVRVHAH